VIRLAGVQDAAAVADINRRGWLFAYADIVPKETMLDAAGALDEHWAQRLADSDEQHPVWMATDGDATPIGYVSIGPPRDLDAGPGDGELYAIYLAPEAVGTGVGHALLERAEASLAQLGYTGATLWVFEANTRARRFYERHGWEAEPDSGPGPWGWARSVRYRKALAP